MARTALGGRKLHGLVMTTSGFVLAMVSGHIDPQPVGNMEATLAAVLFIMGMIWVWKGDDNAR